MMMVIASFVRREVENSITIGNREVVAEVIEMEEELKTVQMEIHVIIFSVMVDV